MDIASSETKLNLMRAFAGESQAKNRYTFAAGKASEQNLYVIEAVFKYNVARETLLKSMGVKWKNDI